MTISRLTPCGASAVSSTTTNDAGWLTLHSAAETQLTATIVAFFRGQSKRILATLGDTIDELTFGAAFDEDAETALFFNTIRADLAEFMEVGAGLQIQAVPLPATKAKAGVRASLGDDFQTPNEVIDEIDSFLTNLAKQPYWKDIQSGTKTKLTEVIRKGIVDGQSGSQLRRNVRDALGDLSSVRSKAIARTETTGALNAGHESAYKYLGSRGMIKGKTWSAIGDKRTRWSHKQMDGQTVPYDRPFNVFGSLGMYPGDYRLPAEERVNCRCTTYSAFLDSYDPAVEAGGEWEDPDTAPPPTPAGPAAFPHYKGTPNEPADYGDRVLHRLEHDEHLKSQMKKVEAIATKHAAEQAKLEEELTKARDRYTQLDNKITYGKHTKKQLAELQAERQKAWEDSAAARQKIKTHGAAAKEEIWDIVGQASPRHDPAAGKRLEIKGTSVPAAQQTIYNNAAEFWKRVTSRPQGDTGNKAEFKVNVVPGIRANAVLRKSINMDPTDSQSVWVHEIGHHVEGVSAKQDATAKAFLKHRMKGEKPQKLKDVIKGSKYDDWETGREDDFFKLFGNKNSAFYAGKEYHDATEVISMFGELLFNNPAKFHNSDPESFKFFMAFLNGTFTN